MERDAQALRTFISLAMLDIFRAERDGTEPEGLVESIDQIIEAANGPADAVLACLQFGLAGLENAVTQAGGDVEEALQAVLTHRPEDD